MTWTRGLDERGRPQNVVRPTAEGTRVSPHVFGATNWQSPSYSPRTELFYVASLLDSYATFVRRPVEYVEGRPFIGAFPTGPLPGLQGGPINRRIPEEGYGAVQAIDPRTGDRKWIFKLTDITLSGVLSTASDLVFAGGREGVFFALDARTGALVWKANVGGEVASGPMSYSVGGRQYIAVASGSPSNFWTERNPGAPTMVVFSLPR